LCSSDLKLVKEIGAHIDVNIKDDDIVRVIRLGKKVDNNTSEGENTHTTRSRPLSITLSNENVKKTLFQNVSKLRDITGELAAVSVDHDMTPKEREETKAMVEEERRKEESSLGKFIFRVRGPPWNLTISSSLILTSMCAPISFTNFKSVLILSSLRLVVGSGTRNMMVIFFLFFRSDISLMSNSFTFVSVLSFVSFTVFGFSTLLHVLFMISWTSSLVAKLSLSGSRHDTKGERRNKSNGGRRKKERGKFFGEVHFQSKRPSLEQVHKQMMKEK
jgi:hypothetical protein